MNWSADAAWRGRQKSPEDVLDIMLRRFEEMVVLPNAHRVGKPSTAECRILIGRHISCEGDLPLRYRDYFSDDYLTAKRRFVAASNDCGASVESHSLRAVGPSGEPLTINVASLGSSDTPRVVIVSSGLHGVEGIFGSAIQLAWLWLHGVRWGPSGHTRLVFVHALNPFGFAWKRRWNENNVDLNRNFLDDRTFLDRDPAYAESRAAYQRLQGFLNPQSPPSQWELYQVKAVFRILSAGYDARRRAKQFTLGSLWKMGIAELQRTLPVGQYEHPRGLFYGGPAPEETVRIVRGAVDSWTAGAHQVVHLDFHSGLGQYGACHLLLDERRGSETEQWATRVFDQRVVEATDETTAYRARGVMGEDLRSRLEGTTYRFLTAEFGTYSAAHVLGALRAENRAHFYDRPGTASYRWAKRQVVEAFCPAASRWRERVVGQGIRLIDRVITALEDTAANQA